MEAIGLDSSESETGMGRGQGRLVLGERSLFIIADVDERRADVGEERKKARGDEQSKSLEEKGGDERRSETKREKRKEGERG